jgi:hypothetical protein
MLEFTFSVVNCVKSCSDLGVHIGVVDADLVYDDVNGFRNGSFPSLTTLSILLPSFSVSMKKYAGGCNCLPSALNYCTYDLLGGQYSADKGRKLGTLLGGWKNGCSQISSRVALRSGSTIKMLEIRLLASSLTCGLSAQEYAFSRIRLSVYRWSGAVNGISPIRR